MAMQRRARMCDHDAALNMAITHAVEPRHAESSQTAHVRSAAVRALISDRARVGGLKDEEEAVIIDGHEGGGKGQHRGHKALRAVAPCEPRLAADRLGERTVHVPPLDGGAVGGRDRQRGAADAEVRRAQVTLALLVRVHRRRERGDDGAVDEAKDDEEREGRDDREGGAEERGAEVAVHDEVEGRLGGLEDEALQGDAEVGDVLRQALVGVVEAVEGLRRAGGGRGGRVQEEDVLFRGAAEAECEGGGVCAGAKAGPGAVGAGLEGVGAGEGGAFRGDGLEGGKDVVLEVGGVEVLGDPAAPVDGEELARCVARCVCDDHG